MGDKFIKAFRSFPVSGELSVCDADGKVQSGLNDEHPVNIRIKTENMGILLDDRDKKRVRIILSCNDFLCVIGGLAILPVKFCIRAVGNKKVKVGEPQFAYCFGDVQAVKGNAFKYLVDLAVNIVKAFR